MDDDLFDDSSLFDDDDQPVATNANPNGNSCKFDRTWQPSSIVVNRPRSCRPLPSRPVVPTYRVVRKATQKIQASKRVGKSDGSKLRAANMVSGIKSGRNPRSVMKDNSHVDSEVHENEYTPKYLEPDDPPRNDTSNEPEDALPVAVFKRAKMNNGVAARPKVKIETRGREDKNKTVSVSERTGDKRSGENRTKHKKKNKKRKKSNKEVDRSEDTKQIEDNSEKVRAGRKRRLVPQTAPRKGVPSRGVVLNAQPNLFRSDPIEIVDLTQEDSDGVSEKMLPRSSPPLPSSPKPSSVPLPPPSTSSSRKLSILACACCGETSHHRVEQCPRHLDTRCPSPLNDAEVAKVRNSVEAIRRQRLQRKRQSVKGGTAANNGVGSVNVNDNGRRASTSPPALSSSVDNAVPSNAFLQQKRASQASAVLSNYDFGSKSTGDKEPAGRVPPTKNSSSTATTGPFKRIVRRVRKQASSESGGNTGIHKLSESRKGQLRRHIEFTVMESFVLHAEPQNIQLNNAIDYIKSWSGLLFYEAWSEFERDFENLKKRVNFGEFCINELATVEELVESSNPVWNTLCQSVINYDGNIVNGRIKINSKAKREKVKWNKWDHLMIVKNGKQLKELASDDVNKGDMYHAFVNKVESPPKNPDSNGNFWHTVRVYVFTPNEKIGKLPGEWQCLVCGNVRRIQRALEALYNVSLFRWNSLLIPSDLNLFKTVNPRIKFTGGDNLNESQLRAVNVACQKADGQHVTLIQGPPGTGKTRTLANIILILWRGYHEKLVRDLRVKFCDCRTNDDMKGFQNGVEHILRKGFRVLACAHSNAAVDELMVRTHTLMTKCADNFLPQMVRVGRRNEKNNGSQFHIDCKIDKLEKQGEGNSEQCWGTDFLKAWDGYEQDTVVNHILSNRYVLGGDLPEGAGKEVLLRFVLSKSDVIFSTMGSAHVVTRRMTEDFHCVIIDEAAQATELDSLLPMNVSCQRLVLVGDTKQLPPTVLSEGKSREVLSRSLYKRLEQFIEGEEENQSGIERGKHITMLDTQYRMHPMISYFPSKHFYQGKLKNDPNGHKICEDLICKEHGNVCTLFPSYVFYDVCGDDVRLKSKSRHNIDEVNFIAKLLHELFEHFSQLRFDDVGIITPYVEQVSELRRAVTETFDVGSNPIEIDTVDAFQGREKSVIVVSLVRQGKTIGFVKSPERMNVMLTRAKHKLLLVGHADTMQKNGWEELLQDAKDRGCFRKQKVN